MSSAANHRKRSHRSYSKHMSAVNGMARAARKEAAKQGFSFKRFFKKIIPQVFKKSAETQQHD